MREVVIAPGVTNANDDIALPVPYAQLASVVRVTLSDGTASGTTTTLSIISSGTPTTGQARLMSQQVLHVGDPLTARDVLIIRGPAVGEYVRV